MEFFQDIISSIEPYFKNIWVQVSLLIIFATAHGYAGAWLAVRMLFRPRQPFKVLGITLFPQGMIPRHRDRLATAIGKAVGEELVSQETIMEELMGKEFLRRKISSVVRSYTDDLLAHEYPSLIESLPSAVREPVLDAISSLQFKIAEYIENVLQSEESLKTVSKFVEKSVDNALSRRVKDVIDDKTFEEIVTFLDEQISSALRSEALANKISEFIERRVFMLATVNQPVSSLFTNDAVVLLKEKAGDQVNPLIHRLTDLAAAEKTRNQIGSLIKKEVHNYYEQLPFFKKIFVSRENLIGEVDELVNESLPKRIEETLKGDFFADEAKIFINNSIDTALSRPIPEIIGSIAPEQLERIKDQIVSAVISLLHGEEMRKALSTYIRDTLQKLRPHSIDAIMQTLLPDSEQKLKKMLSKGLISILEREETSKILNSVLSSQIDDLISKPIGRLSDAISEEKLYVAGERFSETIIKAIQEKLPEAIKEFDVGGVVKEKINNYPVEKLEALVMSVAKEHLRTIELFGAGFGFFIGVIQAIQFYFYAK